LGDGDFDDRERSCDGSGSARREADFIEGSVREEQDIEADENVDAGIVDDWAFEANSDDLDVSKSAEAEFDESNDNADKFERGAGLKEREWFGKDNDGSAAESSGKKDAIAGNVETSSEESLKSRTLKSLKLPYELLYWARTETVRGVLMLADDVT
jgi:hypothetical protein